MFKFLLSLALLVSSLASPTWADSGPRQVDIVKRNGGYQLLVEGEPYEVRGVGLGGHTRGTLEALVKAGGNSVRTWNTDNARELLDEAAEQGVTVALGFDLGKELHGFDYNDEQAVAEQFERLKQAVQRYKDHPALLTWVVANEPNLLMNEDGSLADVNPKVYQAISDIIDYIHEVDPYHPVTYTFAGANPSHIHTAMKYTPQVDFISLQLYADVAHLPEIIEQLEVDKPFMVTEYGAIGHWERPTTDWGREIEEPSGVKAASFAERIRSAFEGNPTGKVIGSYAFLWGQKQERTPTWYGMLNADGKPNARVDELSRYWTGSYPDNRAPLATDITLNGQAAIDSVILKPGQKARLTVEVTDPDGDSLEYRWVLMKEVAERSQGGAFEKKPEELPLNILEEKPGQLVFTAPETPGEYRVFSYSYDGNGKVGNANFPFYVKAD